MECREYKDKDYPIPGRWQISEWKFNRCPRLSLTEDTTYWIVAYKMYKQGFFPKGTGWSEQTNKLIQVISFLDIQINRYQRELEEKHGRQ